MIGILHHKAFPMSRFMFSLCFLFLCASAPLREIFFSVMEIV